MFALLYANENGFLSPSFTSGGNYLPDLLFLILYMRPCILELTAGSQSNLKDNAVRASHKCGNSVLPECSN